MEQGTIARVLNLVEPSSQRLYGMSVSDAEAILASEDPSRVLEIEGSFALVARVDERVLLARSLDRTLRYFLAKEQSGPMLIVAERIDQIHRQLQELGYADQFHPSYTRMVPAHHTTTLRLVGCPDPNPVYRRFFEPEREVLGDDLDVLGERYVGALAAEVRKWLMSVHEREPIGVCFSGGIDSGAVFVAVYRTLLELGQSPARLKAFTLSIGEGGSDARQAREFLRRLDLEMFLEEIHAQDSDLDPLRAVEIIEDYKSLDVECATVLLALLAGIRERYPEWKLLVDGDGGDENLKDYPIEDNSELTIRSVVNNLMLYQEGWGVHSIKHSLTYSGGLSRGYVRTLMPAKQLGFEGFSPFTRPAVIAVAEGIPFARLSEGSHEKLYALKGEVVRRGMRQIWGVDFPVFEKRRFQHGVLPEPGVPSRFEVDPESYRRHFLRRY